MATSERTRGERIRFEDQLADVAISGDYDDLDNTPSLADVATSGDYDDLDTPPLTVVTKAATATLTAAEMKHTQISNYGQAAANTLTLPAAAANLKARFVVSTAGAGALNVKANTGDKLYLDGTALDDGDKATCATPGVGDALDVESIQTGATAYDWLATAVVGTWTDGGA